MHGQELNDLKSCNLKFFFLSNRSLTKWITIWTLCPRTHGAATGSVQACPLAVNICQNVQGSKCKCQ